MLSNTLKTALGFLQSVIERRIPFKRKSVSIGDIYNYLPIDNLFATSGQPTEAQFRLIKSAGYEVVINLAPNSVLENTVINESRALEALGIKYIHIPVDFKKPTEGDFTKFVNSIQEGCNKKIWVHCAANMRASAFTYKYRCAVLGEDEKVANNDLKKIWDPIGIWASFIKTDLTPHSNRRGLH